jgi:ketosteroid isomerase-like protein
MKQQGAPGDDIVAAYFELIAAFNANDLERIVTLFRSDVSYTIPGRSPIAGTAHGVMEHLAQLRKARELSGGTLHLEPQHVVASGERLLVWGRITAQRGERRLDAEHLVTFRYDGNLIAEGRTVPLDLYAFDAFWA